MKERSSVVVGSGAGGLTLALLLARSGRNVTVVESQPAIGGYLRRFTRNGVRFDTGYHFSGGFTNVMAQMNHVLGIDDLVFAKPIANRIVLGESDTDLTLAAGSGHRGAEETFCRHFPKDAAALHKLMQTIRDLWYSNPGRDIAATSPRQLELSRYDAMTVNEFNDSIGIGKTAAAAAGSFAMCHGSMQSEASMAFHARVGFSICDDLARPVNGGDPMIAGFKREAAKLGISVRTGVRLRRFTEPDANGTCRTALLDDDTVLDADEVFFTIHPTAIAEILPERALTASFVSRLQELRDTTSFFCSYFTIDEEFAPEPGLVSYFAHHDIDSIMRGDNSQSTGFLIDRERDAEGKLRATVAAFRPMVPGLPADAPATRAERAHDAKYLELKARLAEDTAAVLARLCPGVKNHLHFVTAGTALTCRDYDPPTGSAYGVRHICGQPRIFGRLPVRNFFAAGQSALAPGVMGTMMTSFAVFRFAVGEETYRRIIRESGLV